MGTVAFDLVGESVIMVHMSTTENLTNPPDASPSDLNDEQLWHQEHLPALMAIANSPLTPEQEENIVTFQRENDAAVARMMAIVFTI
jgi:hypothetical protein